MDGTHITGGRGVSNARVVALWILLAGRLGCQTDLSELASRAVFLLYFQSTSDQHPQVIEQTGMLLRKGVPEEKLYPGLN